MNNKEHALGSAARLVQELSRARLVQELTKNSDAQPLDDEGDACQSKNL